MLESVHYVVLWLGSYARKHLYFSEYGITAPLTNIVKTFFPLVLINCYGFYLFRNEWAKSLVFSDFIAANVAMYFTYCNYHVIRGLGCERR